MKKNIKAEYINKHGQEMWNMVDSYVNHNDRSPEATEAMKLYSRIQKGIYEDTYTTYGIYDLNDNLLYVGHTGTTLKARWNAHKTHAKNLHRASALHYHMNDTVAQYGGEYTDWFSIKPYQVFTTHQEAKDHELLLIDTFNPPYNIYRGGGNKGTLKRPVSQPDDIQTRQL